MRHVQDFLRPILRNFLNYYVTNKEGCSPLQEVYVYVGVRKLLMDISSQNIHSAHFDSKTFYYGTVQQTMLLLNRNKAKAVIFIHLTLYQ